MMGYIKLHTMLLDFGLGFFFFVCEVMNGVICHVRLFVSGCIYLIVRPGRDVTELQFCVADI